MKKIPRQLPADHKPFSLTTREKSFSNNASDMMKPQNINFLEINFWNDITFTNKETPLQT